MDIEKKMDYLKEEIDALIKSNRLLRISINVICLALLIHVIGEFIAG